jgi:hypothetical protein
VRGFQILKTPLTCTMSRESSKYPTPYVSNPLITPTP